MATKLYNKTIDKSLLMQADSTHYIGEENI